MKSDLAAKPMRTEWPAPRPVPKRPPEAKAKRDWASWPEPSPASMEASGWSQSVTRACTCGSRRPTAHAPAPASSSPTVIHPVQPVAT